MRTAKSYRKNRAKRLKSFFKKGHTYFPPRSAVDVLQDPAHVAASLRDCDQNTEWDRPRPDEYWDAVHMSTEDTILPTKLRPAKPVRIHTQNEELYTEENIIANIQSLGQLLQNSVLHQCHRPSMTVSITKRLGLCVTVKAICINCNFHSPDVQLYTTVKRARGPESGALNDGLVLAITKSKMGVSDARFLMCCLNISPPDSRGLQRKLNQMCDRVEDINIASMIDNQRYVRRVNQLLGRGDEVDIETDTSYNNRPQAGIEAATQSFCPVVENTTSRKLVLALHTANKLCCKRNCQHHEKCKKNYNEEDTIASSEAKLLKKNLDFIQNQELLKPRSITSDASAQIQKTIRDYSREHGLQIQHNHCFVHKLRTLQKNLRYIRLRTKLPTGQDSQAYMQRLATCIRARIRYELVKIRKLCRTDQSFLHHAENAVLNVLPCFSGLHDNCKKMSFTCTAHLPGYSPKFLPYGKHLDLVYADMDSIQSAICKQFRREGLQRVCQLSTTNKCENLHQRVFTYAPKNTTWARNFTAMCHSAVHSASHGSGQSVVLLAKEVGLKWKVNGPFQRNMLKRELSNTYHRERKKTRAYKSSRYLARRKKANKKLRELSLYNNATPSTSTEHSYGVNVLPH